MCIRDRYKPLAVAGIALAALAGFFHWITVGPNDTRLEDEEEAAREIRETEEEQVP